MRKQTPVLLLCVCGMLLFFSLQMTFAQVSRQEKIEKRVEKERRELRRLQDEIEKKKKQRMTIEKREVSILSTLEEVNDRLSMKRKELSLIELGVKKKDREIEELQRDLKKLRRDIEEKRKSLREWLLILYKGGHERQWAALFSAANPDDFLGRYYYLRHLSRKEEEALANFESSLLDFERKESKLKEARSELLRSKEESARKIFDIEEEVKKKNTLLASVRGEKGLYVKAVEKLSENATHLQSLIKELEKRGAVQVGKGLLKEKGKLPWPNDGDLIAVFGRDKHPKFDAYIERKGIEIRAGRHDEIKAVYDGTVAFADFFKGYGLLLILDHGEGYFSLYAHANRLTVSPDDRVRRGQVVGEVGEGGLSSEKVLYFEIRNGSIPVNPLLWLKKRPEAASARRELSSTMR